MKYVVIANTMAMIVVKMENIIFDLKVTINTQIFCKLTIELFSHF